MRNHHCVLDLDIGARIEIFPIRQIFASTTTHYCGAQTLSPPAAFPMNEGMSENWRKMLHGEPFHGYEPE